MPSVSDASDVAPLDAVEAAAHQRQHLADAGAGKSAVLELDGLEPGGLRLDPQVPPMPVVQERPDAAVELYKPDGARSAEQSFVVPAAVERWEPELQPNAALAPAELQTEPAMMQRERAAKLRPRPEAVALPGATLPQLEAQAQYEQACPPVWEPQPERRVQAAPVQARALEQEREQVKPASPWAEPPQVSPQPAALPGEVAAEPLPLLSFE
jgi:hypothetical protein